MILKGRNKHTEGNKIVFRKRTAMNGTIYQAGDEVPDQDSMTDHYINKMFRHNIFKDSKETVEAKSETVEDVTEDTSEAEPGSVDSDIAKVVQDSDDDFKVEYKGIVIDIARNQMREDGTLTSGAIKTYNKAKEEE